MELTIPQLRTLMWLYTLGQPRMSDLAIRLGVGMPTVTSLIGKLEEKGLAAREHDTHDRRVVRCLATEQGRGALEQLWQVKQERLDRLIDSLSEAELELVARALEIIIRVAQDLQKEDT